MAAKKRATKKKSTSRKVKAKSKSVARKKPAARAKTKRKVAKTAKKKAVAPKKIGRISKPYTQSQLLVTISEQTGLSKKEVSSVFDCLANVVELHVSGSAGQFTLPRLLKMKVKKVPAKKARKGINPFTGEPTTFKAKPASKKVKITPLKALKEMV